MLVRHTDADGRSGERSARRRSGPGRDPPPGRLRELTVDLVSSQVQLDDQRADHVKRAGSDDDDIRQLDALIKDLATNSRPSIMSLSPAGETEPTTTRAGIAVHRGAQGASGNTAHERCGQPPSHIVGRRGCRPPCAGRSEPALRDAPVRVSAWKRWTGRGGVIGAGRPCRAG
jgi:hypothetical protein